MTGRITSISVIAIFPVWIQQDISKIKAIFLIYNCISDKIYVTGSFIGGTKMGLLSWLFGSSSVPSESHDSDPTYAHEPTNVYHGTAVDPTASTGIDTGVSHDGPAAVACSDGGCSGFDHSDSFGSSSFSSDSFGGSSSFGSDFGSGF